MTIVYILSATDPFGGATKSFMMLLNGVRQHAIMPIVIVPDQNGLYSNLIKEGIETYVIPSRPNTYPNLRRSKDLLLFLPRIAGRFLINYIAIRKMTKLLRNRDVDIIHTNVSVINIGYQSAKRLNIPHVYHVREYLDLDFNIHYFPIQGCIRRQLEHSYSICITKDIQCHHQLTENRKSRIIYNGIMPAQITKAVNVQKNYFLFAGRIEPAKGLYDLVVSYANYADKSKKPLPLYIAGKVIHQLYYKQIIHFIQQKNLENLINILGERNDIYLLMQQAKAIVIPSRFEGFGRCMAEAMFNGCLVIGRYTGGTKEQYDNGLQLEGEEIALKYETGTELSDCLHRVASGTEDFNPYTDRAFHSVNMLYSMETNTSNTIKFYQDIINYERH